VHTLLLNLAFLADQAAAGGGAAPPAAGAAQSGAGQPGTPAAGCGGGGMQPILFMLVMFAVFWFILIRPQQKKAKEHNNMLSGLKKGDQVITRGGVIGRVTGVQDSIVTVEVQEKVRMRFAKSYVEGLFQDQGSSGASDKAQSKSASAPSDAKS
jgi:preprotein translocase subunit YajC